jgi:hypothetical protein
LFENAGDGTTLYLREGIRNVPQIIVKGITSAVLSKPYKCRKIFALGWRYLHRFNIKNGYVQDSVTDQGLGPEGAKEKIFSKFYRIDNDDQEKELVGRTWLQSARRL